MPKRWEVTEQCSPAARQCDDFVRHIRIIHTTPAQCCWCCCCRTATQQHLETPANSRLRDTSMSVARHANMLALLSRLCLLEQFCEQQAYLGPMPCFPLLQCARACAVVSASSAAAHEAATGWHAHLFGITSPHLWADIWMAVMPLLILVHD